MHRTEHRSPRTARRLRVAMVATATTLLLACAACPFAPAEPIAATTDGAAPAGIQFWRELFAGIARDADRGDARAARIALEMYRFAPQVYGGHFDASPAQLQAWRCRAAGQEPPCTILDPAA